MKPYLIAGEVRLGVLSKGTRQKLAKFEVAFTTWPEFPEIGAARGRLHISACHTTAVASRCAGQPAEKNPSTAGAAWLRSSGVRDWGGRGAHARRRAPGMWGAP